MRMYPFLCTHLHFSNSKYSEWLPESKISLLQGIHMEKRLFWDRTEGSLVRNVRSPKLIWRSFMIYFESSYKFHITLTALWSLKLQFVSDFVEDKPPPRAWNYIYVCDTYSFHGKYISQKQLTPWNRVFLENLVVSQLVEKIPEFHGTRWFSTFRHLSLFWAISFQCTSLFKSIEN